MSSQGVINAPAGRVPNHRACDECRTRKLACSKEHEGCWRCKRGHILCHYSPQKPMGRPRKHCHVHRSLPGAGPDPGGADVLNEPIVSQKFGGFDAQWNPPEESGVDSFGQDVAPNMNLLGSLPNNLYKDNNVEPYDVHSWVQAQAYDPTSQPFDCSAFPMQCGGIDLAQQGASLGEPGCSAATVPKNADDDLLRLMMPQRFSPPEGPQGSVPADMLGLGGLAEYSPGEAAQAMPNVACGCVSSAHSALESLSHLPLDPFRVMCLARRAGMVAQDVVDCRHCSAALFGNTPLEPPSIQGLQSFTLLCTLLSAACNAYAFVLSSIDAETTSATTDSRPLFFSLKDMGGLGANIVDENSTFHQLNNHYLEPQVWRQMMRAILRLDVYGLGDVPNTPAAPQGPRGLRGVLAQLDRIVQERRWTR